jgi:hypothetical protein
MLKKWKAEDPAFFDDPRNLLLGICIDAFNPFDSGTYSITPIVLFILNLPAQVGILYRQPLQPFKQLWPIVGYVGFLVDLPGAQPPVD